MRLIFSRSNTLGSPIIRAACWGPWSHCGVLTRDDTVIEAAWPAGVREVRLDAFISHATRWDDCDVAVPDEAAGVAWARSQIGKPYDTLGVIGLGLRRDWQDDDKWWCSEFTEMALLKAGRARYRGDMHRITPTHSWIAV